MRALAIACAIVIGWMGTARADARAEAILLFEQGVKEMKAGNTEKACQSFEQSNQLYPDSGTKGSLAKCYEKLGKLASSWLLWRELADTAASADLRKDAASQAAKLDPKMPKYLIKAAGTPGLAVTINGKPSGVTGLAVPIDAGKVLVVATAPDHHEWKTELTAVDGQTLAVDIPVLVKAPKKVEPVPVIDASKRKKRRAIAAIVGGVGLAAIAGGAFFGVSANGKFGDAKDLCGGDIDQCAPARVGEAQVLVDDARSAANLSSILFAAGGAMVVTGAVLWFTAPGVEQRMAISPTGNGVAISGRF
jgi:tetratricopeptide (TPR) repeat protein